MSKSILERHFCGCTQLWPDLEYQEKAGVIIPGEPNADYTYFDINGEELPKCPKCNYWFRRFTSMTGYRRFKLAIKLELQDKNKVG